MIRIQNIYYMLSYAFQVLKEQGYTKCSTEEFENTADLLSSILVKGISVQIKRGLGKEYIDIQEPLSSLRGKIDISESIKTQSLIKQQLVCTYDEFSVNSYLNRILKTTLGLLLRYDIPKARKKEIRNTLLYLKDVDTLDLYKINWNIRFNRNNQTYQMLITVCYLVVKGLLQTDSQGNMKMQKFLDEQKMCRLYEKFILEYYRKKYPKLKASASQIPWQLDNGISTMLPVMQSDIMLTDGSKTLIIDAKYYSKTMQMQFNKRTLHSNNLYQIFTYVKNRDAYVKKELGANAGEVAGMLLYAKTDEEITSDNDFQMSGNKISTKTLDLNLPFDQIANQLNKIADDFFKKDILTA
ncbi:MAG: 5-methylcytosine-specific restriction endonuclease system specificity protein McrC [Treponema sp. CETP13]|nr:MAG: 5-methylcytosine-specific restriction endonuclease system specificity protein McrC [Treponema sp. CETP13]